MKTPSRYMPPYVHPPTRWYTWLLIVLFAGAVLYALAHFIFIQPVLALLLIGAITVTIVVHHRREHRRMMSLIAAREGESICEFARSFRRQKVDTWVIRCVYEQLGAYWKRPVPVRASDLAGEGSWDR